MGRAIPLRFPEPTSGPPPFEKVGVVGLSAVGGSVALATRRAWPTALVVGVDQNDVIEVAQRACAVDVAGDDLGMLAGVDLVVLTAPHNSSGVFSLLPEAIPGRALLTEVAPGRETHRAASGTLPDRLRFVAGHALVCPRGPGFGAASPDLFSERPWLLMADETSESREGLALASFVGALGARPIRIQPDDHDALLAFVRGLSSRASALLQWLVVGAEGPTDPITMLAGVLAPDPRPSLGTSEGQSLPDLVASDALEALAEATRRLRGRLASPALLDPLIDCVATARARLSR